MYLAQILVMTAMLMIPPQTAEPQDMPRYVSTTMTTASIANEEPFQVQLYYQLYAPPLFAANRR